MARWFKRIVLAVLLLAVVLVATAAVVAWRAGRTPPWYATAVDQTPPDEAADRVIDRQFVPMQNWLARTSAGDLAARPDAEKVHTLDLTDADVNAVIAKFFDHQRGEAETFRVRFDTDAIELAFNLTQYGRTASVTTAIARTADGRPTVALGPVRVGEQTAPSWLLDRFTAGPAARVRTELDQLKRTGKPPRIDERDAASQNTVKAAYGRMLLDILAGRAVPPPALLPVSREGDDFVATRVTQLDATPGRLRVTFRMMTPVERDELLAELNGPLPGEK